MSTEDVKASAKKVAKCQCYQDYSGRHKKGLTETVANSDDTCVFCGHYVVWEAEKFLTSYDRKTYVPEEHTVHLYKLRSN